MRADQIVLQEFGNLGIHQYRLRCIAKVTMAVLTASRMALTPVGRALGGMAKPKYGIKCVDSLLGNVLLRAASPSHRLDGHRHAVDCG